MLQESHNRKRLRRHFGFENVPLRSEALAHRNYVYPSQENKFYGAFGLKTAFYFSGQEVDYFGYYVILLYSNEFSEPEVMEKNIP